jgi:hypothetical protein
MTISFREAFQQRFAQPGYSLKEIADAANHREDYQAIGDPREISTHEIRKYAKKEGLLVNLQDEGIIVHQGGTTHFLVKESDLIEIIDGIGIAINSKGLIATLQDTRLES